MTRTPTRTSSFRLPPRYLEWLGRNGKSASRQLRDDLDALRVLYETADRDVEGGMTLSHAAGLVRDLQDKGLLKTTED